MNITDVLNSPWAIMPEKLRAISEVYAAHLRREKVDIDAIEARIGRPLVNAEQGYDVVDGVAVIPIAGVIGKKMNMMSAISGGASTELITRDINAAIADPDVNSILLRIESPGGTVDGTEGLANLVRVASGSKPIMAFADGLMASAAYWIGSAAIEIVASGATTMVGSIGVVTSHTDVSKANADAGYTVTDISAGKYKRIASQNAPLSEEGRATIQDQVDQIYSIFVNTVASNRGVSVDVVLADMADGRVFLADQAQTRGLIDHIATFEETIYNMSTGVWPMSTAKPEKVEMTLAELRAAHPELCALIANEAATTECLRIQGCEDATLPGYEALVAGLKFDGKSTGGDIALAIIAKEKELKTKALTSLENDAPNVVKLEPAPVVEATATNPNLPVEDRAKAEWDKGGKELQASYAGNFEWYLAALKAEESGKVKILGKK